VTAEWCNLGCYSGTHLIIKKDITAQHDYLTSLKSYKSSAVKEVQHGIPI